MDKAAAGHLDPGTMAATDAPIDLLQKMLHGREDVRIGNINAPNQVVLSGHTEAIKDLGQSLKRLGLPVHPLAGQHGLPLSHHERYP